jgi:hypothetical protein
MPSDRLNRSATCSHEMVPASAYWTASRTFGVGNVAANSTTCERRSEAVVAVMMTNPFQGTGGSEWRPGNPVILCASDIENTTPSQYVCQYVLLD